MLQRIFKTVAALGVGQLLHLVAQLAIPPVFIAAHGVDGFALWLLLTAAISHLATLDFGLQTYLVNELTLLYHRGDRKRFHEIQSVGTRLALALVALGVLFACATLSFQVGAWIGVPDSWGTRLTLAFLALQVIGAILLGQFIGLYRVLGQAQKGVHWHNLQKAVSLGATLALAASGASFWVIAGFQALSIWFVLVCALFRLRRISPEVFPRIDYWNCSDARLVLRQSSFFGLFSLNQLLVFQIPILLLNRFTTPDIVVAYSLGRTLFSFVRQLSNLLMAALAPELTRLMGSNDRATLGRAFRSVESIVCATAFVGCTSVYVVAPWVLKLWLGKPQLFSADLYVLLMLASLFMLVKESKLYFQHATNEHVPTAVMTSVVYSLALLVGIPASREWGANGLLVCWIGSELIQICFLQRYNRRLLGNHESINASVLWKISISTFGLAALLWKFSGLFLEGAWVLQAAKATAFLVFVSASAFLLFDLTPLARESWERLRRFSHDRFPRLLMDYL